MHREFVRRVARHVDEGAPQPLTPALDELRALIEGTPRIYMYFVQMFDEIPRRQPYLRDPVGSRQIRDYGHLLQVLNHVVRRAPEWTDAAESVGVVGVPMCSLLDYPMATPRCAVSLQRTPSCANKPAVMPPFSTPTSTAR